MIFDECLAALQSLIIDVFGNYVIQKLIKNGKSLHRAYIIDQIHGKMIKLAKNKYGCRVVHIAFEFAEEDQRELLVAELKNCSIVDMIMD
jgi:pumilio RNA-binding family